MWPVTFNNWKNIMKSKSTKNTPKTPAEDETSLDCEARFNFKFKKVKIEQKLSFYLILTYMLLTTLFSENNLLLPLREAFLFILGERAVAMRAANTSGVLGAF
jgi:hypothetical protein